MASPQLENGYVRIANELVEALARTHLSSHESQILWALWRKTYGWHKKSDRISLAQFATATGLRKDVCSRTLTRLIERKIIDKNVNGKVATYRFLKNFDNWKTIDEIANNRQKRQETLAKTSTLRRSKGKPGRAPQTSKDTITKDKNIVFTKVNNILKNFCNISHINKYLSQFKTQSMLRHGRDLTINKKLRLLEELDQICRGQSSLDGKPLKCTEEQFYAALDRVCERRFATPLRNNNYLKRIIERFIAEEARKLAETDARLEELMKDAQRVQSTYL